MKRSIRAACGGALKEECYAAYALYLVKYIQAMQEEGVAIEAITIQNEPLNSKNTPSMRWQLNQQLVFLRDHLYPAFTGTYLLIGLVEIGPRRRESGATRCRFRLPPGPMRAEPGRTNRGPRISATTTP